MLNSIVNDAIQNSVQSRARNGTQTGIPLLLQLASGTGLLPPWWSPARDVALRNFWKKGDHLAGAQYNMIAKMTAIPFSAVPRDYTDINLAEEAEKETQRILDGAEFGAGFVTFYSKTLEDMIGQDNGWFAEVIGPGNPAGPIIGQPITVAHLDAARCQRTGDPTYPVLYQDSRGKLFKLHYARVMFGSQLPSAQEEMYDVGFCAVSRATMAAQNLMDIAIYKMEKLGSRPHRELLLTGGGLDPDDLRNAFMMADASMDNLSLSRYSKIIIAGNATMPDSRVQQVTFNTLPDGFDEKTAITLGMAVIAMAYGVDARDLFPAMEAGATRADALLQHLKQRGKGPGQIITDIEAQFNRKFLPPTMKMTFDFQDDSEDQQVAEIKHVRAQRRERDVGDKIIDLRTAREQMIADNDLTRQQFQMLELKDGRLEDGTPVIALFHSSDPVYKKFLVLEDVENPLDITSNDATYITVKADEAIMKVNEALLDAKTPDKRLLFQRASAALEQLKKMYQESQVDVSAVDSGRDTSPRSYPTRRQNLTSPNPKVELSTNVPTANPTNIEGKELSAIWEMVDQLQETLEDTVQVQKATSQPIINIQPPNVIVNMPESVPIEVSTDAVGITTLPPAPATVEVDVAATPNPSRIVEYKSIEKDPQGKILGTRILEEYEYEVSNDPQNSN